MMTVRQLIGELEAFAEHHGDEIPVTLPINITDTAQPVNLLALDAAGYDPVQPKYSGKIEQCAIMHR